jgi:hypothetical protein
MIAWAEFEHRAPEVASAGLDLLRRNEVAFLATVSTSGRPRLHPFVPRVVEGRMLAFIMDSSPKIGDLRYRKQYSIHALPGADDEEFYVTGEAQEINHDARLRSLATDAMGFATGVDEHHVLFEFAFDRALHTVWLDFGTPNHRPKRLVWRL